MVLTDSGGKHAIGDSAGPSFGDAGAAHDSGATSCVAPDMLVTLDRTLTMHRTPAGDVPVASPAGYASSKWSMAIEAIKAFTAPPLDSTINFGLELWPKLQLGCVTLEQIVSGTPVSAPNYQSCLGPDIVVPPALTMGASISSSLDPLQTLLCGSTPTGAALIGAKAELELLKAAGKRQFVVLVTDGADWDLTCPDPNPLGIVDDLAAAGISTVVVGFSAEASLTDGVGAAFLNDMACAGGTAKGYPATCTTPTGTTGSRAVNPDAGAAGNVFYSASNASELETALNGFAQTVCCNCVPR